MPDKYVNANFYDIESLRNVFTLANLVTRPDKEDRIEIYYLCRPKGQPLGEDVILPEGWQPLMAARIRERNPSLVKNYPRTKIRFYDLHTQDAIDHLARTFGMSSARYVNDPQEYSIYPKEYRLVCDTDDGLDGTEKYDPDIHPYLLGYNSYNYDTTMLAQYLSKAVVPAQQKDGGPILPCTYNLRITPDEMRDFNNTLFEPDHIDSMPSVLGYRDNAWIIRKNMLMSGRHLDVARLNEKQRKVGLKRLLGMLGYQILESDRLDTGVDVVETPDQMFDLVAYNVSDIANLRLLFYHKQYQGQFELKKAMLSQYKELTFLKKDDAYEPDVRKSKVDKARLLIDSSSAQFATRMLCPYGHIKDIEAVSYLYPAKEKAEQLGIPQVNVLEEAKKFFYDAFPGEKFTEVRAEFDRVYDYYKAIEGQNFNDSSAYMEDYGSMLVEAPTDPVRNAPGFLSAGAGPGCATLSLPPRNFSGNAPIAPGQMAAETYQTRPTLPAMRLSDIKKAETCMHYYDADGNPTGCFALFSVGGIHGAEYNKPLFDADMANWRRQCAYMGEVQALYPNPVDFRQAHPKTIVLSDGTEHKSTEFLKGGRTIQNSEYKRPEDNKPSIFKSTGKGDAELNKKYVYTSAALANHEDFVSYYPNLLIQMMALYNPGLGYDRYEEIFNLKQKYGKLMKDPSLPESERENYRILREGTKLVLNSASGAAAALFENNIRANNQILSMRIIGQLFTWRIGQAQSLKGARIISTNTDGLYSVMEATLNDKVLAEESKSIHVEIEPEPMYLISKDTNNRIELDGNGPSPKILSASGGTLGCHKGPNPTKALAHPAVIDWALREYLVKTALDPAKGLGSDFDRDLGASILASALDDANFGRTAKALTMYQNVLASSAGSVTYIFGTKEIIADENRVPTDEELMDPASYDAPDPFEPIVLQTYNRAFLVRQDSAPHIRDASMHLYAATARAITPPIRKKRDALRAQDPNIRPTEADPIAVKVLEANGAPTYFDNKDIVVKKVTGIEPAWNVIIDNRDLFTLDRSTVEEIIDNLDMNLYLKLLDNAYTNNWKNVLPAVSC